jgi:VWA domain-containing protein
MVGMASDPEQPVPPPSDGRRSFSSKGTPDSLPGKGQPVQEPIAGDAKDEETRAAVENFIFEVSAGKSSGSRRRGRGSIGKIAPAARPANIGPGARPDASSTPASRPPDVMVNRPDAMVNTADQPVQPVAKRDQPDVRLAAPARESQPARRLRRPGQSSRQAQLEQLSKTGSPKQIRPEAMAARERASGLRMDAARVVVTQASETFETRTWLDAIRHTFGNMSSLGVSLIIHAVLLLLLSFYTLANLQPEENLDLFSSVPMAEEMVDFSVIEIDPTEELDALSEEFSADLIDPGQQSLAKFAATDAMAHLSSDSDTSATSLEEIGALFDESGQGLADLGAGAGGASVSFFGTRVQAKRILFLLDNSGSMRGGRLETMIEETTRSIEALSPKQHFYVLFYSDTVYPLFSPQPATQFVRATDQNKRLLIQWLATVELFPGNALDEAIQVATAIRPDVVYFLTDGDVNTTRDGRKLKLLLDTQGRTFSIHTFGMGAGTEGKFAENLLQIAKANGGTYRPVDVTPQMQEMAKKNPRKYHKAR